MPRRKVIQDSLEYSGLLLGPGDEEWGRLTPNKTLVLNEQALYLWLLRYASKHGTFKIPTGPINKTWSLSGGHGYDPYVDAALRNLSDLDVIDIYVSSGNQIIAVSTRMSAARAMQKIPAYITRAEKMSGLESVNEDGDLH